MTWIEAIVGRLGATFGGIVTFCEDPDGLLDSPAVREALRAAGMRPLEWEGDRSFLRGFLTVAENDRPLLIVRKEGLRSVAESQLSGPRWETVSLGMLFRKFHIETVRQTPQSYWDQLLALHGETKALLNATETAIHMGRALFGIDPLHLQFADGWVALLASIAVSATGLPAPVAEVTARWAPTWLPKELAKELLGNPSAARAALPQLLKDHPELEASASDATRVLIHHTPRTIERAVAKKWQAIIADKPLPSDGTGREVLTWALDYARGLAEGAASDELCRVVNQAFYQWVQKHYTLMINGQDSHVLKIHTLLRKLDDQAGETPLLLIVVDSLSLSGWLVWEKVWRAQGIIGECVLNAAFTGLPTVTSICRRALFEESLPDKFRPGEHSQSLERRLWTHRFGDEGAYFAAEELQGIRDAFSLGRRRIAVVDVSWDRKGHGIDPRYESPEELAVVWAERTDLRELVREAHHLGYRVVITSDHGHIKCEGSGRPDVGVLTEERSQRVLIFGKESLWQSYARSASLQGRVWDYRPHGLRKDFWPLFAADQYGFGYAGSLAVSHGGISLEEAIIPVAEVYAP